MEFLEVFLVFCLIFSKKENKIKNLYVSMQWFLGGPFLWASLFLVYINHLGKELSSSVKLFANNTFVSSITHAINTSADQKSENLTIINTWVTITHSKPKKQRLVEKKDAPTLHYISTTLKFPRTLFKSIFTILDTPFTFQEHLRMILDKKGWESAELL